MSKPCDDCGLKLCYFHGLGWRGGTEGGLSRILIVFNLVRNGRFGYRRIPATIVPVI